MFATLPLVAAVLGAPPAVTPRLVVVVVVDQLRAEDLVTYAPLLGSAGLGGLQKRGVLLDGRYLAANTETAPGHAALSTGAYADENGVVANLYFAHGALQHAVRDPAHPRWGSTDAAAGRSPRVLRVPTVGDQLKLSTRGRARVAAVAGKDRSALLSAGYAADLATWFETDVVGFTSSTFYGPEPAWFADHVRRNPVVPPGGWSWTLALPAERYAALGLVDEAAGESVRHGMPATLPKLLPAGSELGAALRMTPRVDEATVDLALAAVQALDMGADDVPDLLWVGLSGHDAVGHAYGPSSLEHVDALVRDSAQVARLVAAVEKRVGSGRVAWVVTGDHGVTPLVEETAALRIPARRLEMGEVTRAVDAALDSAAGERDWVTGFSPPHLWLRPEARELGCAVIGRAAHAASEVEGVARAVAGCSLRALSDPVLEPLRLAHDPERGGHILVEHLPLHTWRDPSEPDGTDHGSRWLHDQRVPLLMVLPQGFRLAVEADDAVDMRRVSPSLSVLLGIPPAPAARQPPLVRR